MVYCVLTVLFNDIIALLEYNYCADSILSPIFFQLTHIVPGDQNIIDVSNLASQTFLHDGKNINNALTYTEGENILVTQPESILVPPPPVKILYPPARKLPEIQPPVGKVYLLL